MFSKNNNIKEKEKRREKKTFSGFMIKAYFCDAQ
jgi:hypothetical protein